jgi:hypothetical protein
VNLYVSIMVHNSDEINKGCLGLSEIDGENLFIYAPKPQIIINYAKVESTFGRYNRT